ncbi:MAG: hypothetical protein FWF34_02005 [Alphaproteobacteria bacterium]|nr:hypothetical protein [Alphaproteobacteria bacterium]MCL2890007.1 hypothetical protein [Alphaproteobacteria bacterium]
MPVLAKSLSYPQLPNNTVKAIYNVIRRNPLDAKIARAHESNGLVQFDTVVHTINYENVCIQVKVGKNTIAAHCEIDDAIYSVEAEKFMRLYNGVERAHIQLATEIDARYEKKNPDTAAARIRDSFTDRQRI